MAQSVVVRVGVDASLSGKRWKLAAFYGSKYIFESIWQEYGRSVEVDGKITAFRLNILSVALANHNYALE